MNGFEGFVENEGREHGLNGLRNWFEGFADHVGWVEDDGVLGEGNVGAIGGAVGGVAGGRVFIGRRSRCRLCGMDVSYANRARHEQTHRLWDPGGGPHPA